MRPGAAPARSSTGEPSPKKKKKNRCYAAVRQAFEVPLCDCEGMIFVFHNLCSNKFFRCSPAPDQLRAAPVKHRCYAAVRQAFRVALCDFEGMIFVFHNLCSNNFCTRSPAPDQLGAAPVKHRRYAAVRQAFTLQLCDFGGGVCQVFF